MDGPVVAFRIALAPAVGREQPVGSHHAEQPRPGDPNPVDDPQARMHLPMALALERRPGQVGANRREQLLVREQGLGPAGPSPCRRRSACVRRA